jgi:predicted outer membrane repeat protein
MGTQSSFYPLNIQWYDDGGSDQSLQISNGNISLGAQYELVIVMFAFKIHSRSYTGSGVHDYINIATVKSGVGTIGQIRLDFTGTQMRLEAYSNGWTTGSYANISEGLWYYGYARFDGNVSGTRYAGGAIYSTPGFNPGNLICYANRLSGTASSSYYPNYLDIENRENKSVTSAGEGIGIIFGPLTIKKSTTNFEAMECILSEQCGFEYITFQDNYSPVDLGYSDPDRFFVEIEQSEAKIVALQDSVDDLEADIAAVQSDVLNRLLTTAFDTWKASWTSTRAVKLDFLNANIDSIITTQLTETLINTLSGRVSTTAVDTVIQVLNGVKPNNIVNMKALSSENLRAVFQ